MAAPLVVQRGPAGAVVIETAAGIEPTDDDLELLALFSVAGGGGRAQHARAGAAAQRRPGRARPHGHRGRPRAEEPAGRAAALRAPPGGAARGTATPTAPASRRRSPRPSIIWPPWCRRSPPSAGRPSCTACPRACTRCSTSAWRSRRPCETPGVEVVRAYDAALPGGAARRARAAQGVPQPRPQRRWRRWAPGGRLTVTTGYAAETRTVTVIVEDTGVGMSEETLSRMFDLFFTTKPQGTGLGMALARSVIDLHGGELTINSTVGQGHAGHGAAAGRVRRRRRRRSAAHETHGPGRRRRGLDRRRPAAHARGRGLLGAHRRLRPHRAGRGRPGRRPCGHRRPDAAGRRRAGAHARAEDPRPRPGGHRHHRLRLGAQGDGGHQGRRRLPRRGEAVRARRGARARARPRSSTASCWSRTPSCAAGWSSRRPTARSSARRPASSA